MNALLPLRRDFEVASNGLRIVSKRRGREKRLQPPIPINSITAEASTSPQIERETRMVPNKPVLLRPKKAAAYVGLSEYSLRKILAASKFPRPVTLDGSIPNAPLFFVQSELDQWLLGRLAAREALQ